jgi:ABC-type amino acid transport substrate-binding protein
MDKHCRALFCALVLLASATAYAAGKFTLCTSETPFLPISSVDPSQPGTAQILIELVAKKLGISVTHIATPWKRCQVMVEQGLYDAMNITGYAGINPTIAVFPMANAAVDTNKSLGSVPTVLYRRVGTQADFVDGKFVGTGKPIAILAGRQVNKDAIERAGATSEDGAKTVQALAQKLLTGQVDMAASAETELVQLVDSQYHGVLEAVRTPLTESHYYLVFSKPYYQSHGAEVEAFWNEMARMKKSPEFLSRINR